MERNGLPGYPIVDKTEWEDLASEMPPRQERTTLGIELL